MINQSLVNGCRLVVEIELLPFESGYFCDLASPLLLILMMRMQWAGEVLRFKT